MTEEYDRRPAFAAEAAREYHEQRLKEGGLRNSSKRGNGDATRTMPDDALTDILRIVNENGTNILSEPEMLERTRNLDSGKQRFLRDWLRREKNCADAFIDRILGEQINSTPSRDVIPLNRARADELVTVPAAEVKMRAIRWLWPNRFALGKLGIIGGMPDMGKGLITANMISTVTKGGAWPCKEGRAAVGNVILLTAEDDLDDTVAPRLMAAAADMSRVHIVKMVRTKQGGRRMFSLVVDLPLLAQKIKDIGDVVLVVIDPLSAYLGVGKIDGYRTTDVRGVLSPLTELAAEHKVSIIGIMHFNKNTNVTNAMLRLSDSLAFVAASRHAYVVADEPDSADGRKLFLKAKNNLSSPEAKALAYTFGVVTVGLDEELKIGIEAPRVLWSKEHVDMTAEQALKAAQPGDKTPSLKDDCVEFLRQLLRAEGPMPSAEMIVGRDVTNVDRYLLNVIWIPPQFYSPDPRQLPLRRKPPAPDARRH
jgi:hypothetical protein